MSLRFHNRNESPSGGFRFFVAETKTWITGIDWNQFTTRVKNHYHANNLPVGLLFEETLEDQACRNTDPKSSYQDGEGTVRVVSEPTTFKMLKNATSVLVGWFKDGGKRESKDEIERRASTCVQCKFNQPAINCPSCGFQSIRDLINAVVANDHIDLDKHLHACRFCGCSLQAKIRIPLEVIQKNDPDYNKVEYPDYCWLYKQKE